MSIKMREKLPVISPVRAIITFTFLRSNTSPFKHRLRTIKQFLLIWRTTNTFDKGANNKLLYELRKLKQRARTDSKSIPFLISFGEKKMDFDVSWSTNSFGKCKNVVPLSLVLLLFWITAFFPIKWLNESKVIHSRVELILLIHSFFRMVENENGIWNEFHDIIQGINCTHIL